MAAEHVNDSAGKAGLLRRLVHSFPGMAYRCLHDADWTLEFASGGCLELLGYTVDELVTQRVVAVADLIHPDDLAKVSLEVEKGLAERAPFGCVYRMRTRGGDYKWISEVGRGVFDDRGDLEAIEGFLSDVTRVVEGREASRVAERREIIGRMAAGIAHDFNNIITGVLGAVALARTADDPRSATAELAAIEQLAQRAAGLTSQLLAFGRPRAMGADPIDLVPALADVETLLGRVLGQTTQIDLRMPQAPVLCRMDPVQLEQIVMNLAINARDAMPNGGVVTIALAAGADHAELTVTDAGDGIEESLLPRVFEPYFTTKDSTKGTGLGLATVRSIVEEVGGRIAVRSALGRGSTFEVRLPLSRGVSSASSLFGSEVLLVAEDEDAVRHRLCRGLRRLGYTVLEAADGKQALELSERHKGPLDLLLTDGRMPRLGGIELAQKLREARPRMPAILLTGDRHRGPPDLFAIELDKPLTPEELAGHIRRILDS